MGVFRRGCSCNSRFVLNPDFAIASEVPVSSKNSLAINDFLSKKTQLVNSCEDPLPGTPPPPILRYGETIVKIIFIIFAFLKGGGGLRGRRGKSSQKRCFSWKTQWRYISESANLIVEKFCCHCAGSYIRDSQHSPFLFEVQAFGGCRKLQISQKTEDLRKRAEYGCESTASNTELSDFFVVRTEFRGENSVSSSQPTICVPKRSHRVSRRTHRVCPQTQWGSVSSLLQNSTLETEFRFCFLDFPRNSKSGVCPLTKTLRTPHTGQGLCKTGGKNPCRTSWLVAK